MYALLKHIHGACWDLRVTKQPRCEVWNVYLSRQCAVSVWGCSEWGIEMARWHRMAVQADFAKSCLSPNYHLCLQHHRYLSNSQQPPHPLKTSCTAESILMGDTNVQASHTRDGDLKDFINSVYYFISLEQNKEHIVHNGIYRNNKKHFQEQRLKDICK